MLCKKKKLCDIGDFDFLDYASALKRTSTCSAKTGWFTALTWTEIKRRVSDVVDRALAATSGYMDDFETFLRAALAKALSGDKMPHKALQCSALLPGSAGELREGSFLQRYLSIPDVIATENDILVETISAITGANKEPGEQRGKSIRGRGRRPKSTGSRPRTPSKRAVGVTASGKQADLAEESTSGRRVGKTKTAAKRPPKQGSRSSLPSQSDGIEQLLPSLQMLNEVEAFDIFGETNELVESGDSASSSDSSETGDHELLSDSSYSRTDSSDSEASGDEPMDADIDVDPVETTRRLDQVRALGLGSSYAAASQSSRISNETAEERILRELSSVSTVYTV